MKSSTCFLILMFVGAALLICTSMLICSSYLEKNKPRRFSSLTYALKQAVDSWMSEMPGGAVAVAIVSPEDNEYFFAGHLTSNKSVLPNERTIFELASIAKGFTGLLLADQILSGNVFLKDTLSKLLTDWPRRFYYPAGKLKLSELATHSSGLARLPGNYLPAPLPDNPFANYTVKKLYRWLAKSELVTRTSFQYSNTGASILGHALAVNEGQTYEQLLKQRILIPLGLLDTTITLDRDQQFRLTPGHAHNGVKVSNWDLGILTPSGQLRSTISDMVHFLRLATGLDKMKKRMTSVFRLATRPQKDTQLDSPFPRPTVGLFWLQSLLPHELMIVWHLGGTAGYTSFIGWIPERQIGIIVLGSIYPAATDKLADNLAFSLLKLKLDF